MNLINAKVGDQAPEVTTADSTLKVVYLFGAGASHGSAKWSGSSTGLLMADLAEDISRRLHEFVKDEAEYQRDPLRRLINDVLDTDSDVEQVITFLEESGTPDHNLLAARLRTIFRESLTKRLEDISEELSIVPANLYAALIDLHLIPGFEEWLGGFLTLNYDRLIDHAIHSLHGKEIDYGIHVANSTGHGGDSILLLKLHGSFDWCGGWPINVLSDADAGNDPLWIPPGIQKAKAAYPFNLLWGKARELLECDVFRVVGCNLSANDWDLISMLFRTKHGHAANRVYEIEVIDTPRRAREMQRRFPYLKIKSLLDLDGIGEAFVSEMLGIPEQRFETLEDLDQERILDEADKRIGNPFFYWLKLKAEHVAVEVDSIDTNSGLIAAFLNSSP